MATSPKHSLPYQWSINRKHTSRNGWICWYKLYLKANQNSVSHLKSWKLWSQTPNQTNQTWLYFRITFHRVQANSLHFNYSVLEEFRCSKRFVWTKENTQRFVNSGLCCDDRSCRKCQVQKSQNTRTEREKMEWNINQKPSEKHGMAKMWTAHDVTTYEMAYSVAYVEFIIHNDKFHAFAFMTNRCSISFSLSSSLYLNCGFMCKML